MSEGPPSPKRVKFDPEEFNGMLKEDLISKLQEQNDLIKSLESKIKAKSSEGGAEDDSKDADDKSKQLNIEAVRRENTLVMRLNNKEQELQDCMNQIQEMKAGQTTSMAQLRTMLLDPAVNLVFQRITKEMEESKEKLKQTQNELSAWKFTPDSQTGKRLMVKCRMLLQENEELGKMIASGKTAKLEGEIALQKTLVTEMKKGQEEMDEFVADLEEDVEGMQSMIYLLQQQLKDTKEQLAQLQTENEQLRKNVPQTNGVSMETDNIVVETKSLVDQSSVCSNNSSPSSHHSASLNHIHPVTSQDSTRSKTNDLDLNKSETKTIEPEITKHSGNGDLVDITGDTEEPMETDNITESRSDVLPDDIELRTPATNILAADSNLKTIETTYDSSDTWSPPHSNNDVQSNSPGVTKTSTTDAQDIVSNGLETVKQSEVKVDVE